MDFGFTDFETGVRTLFSLAVGVAAAIFIIMLLIGGVQYLTSLGNEEATTKSKKLLIDAIIGIIVVAIAWAAGTWVLSEIGISPAFLG
ncbi:hypothetical protein A3F08_02535 [Candidatus Berkelbacteria bacterium RIFCSPHIGHO2_12_FULL_36_9]|uniref:Uncharacterized protein n=1 Tax=Candidatus Berkelbacteria bacterium RIFCSPHIGHO2_12_FULL_36_9 TaxID=1797469 RepID=A0A1F5EFP3_9BACT|nr:MAG: hypothetical protein A3F08_02535 [Candidatus Berkelbacteria bacterium RIFCSPHIGHO2_12_FULL_36_9]